MSSAGAPYINSECVVTLLKHLARFTDHPINIVVDNARYPRNLKTHIVDFVSAAEMQFDNSRELVPWSPHLPTRVKSPQSGSSAPR